MREIQSQTEWNGFVSSFMVTERSCFLLSALFTTLGPALRKRLKPKIHCCQQLEEVGECEGVQACMCMAAGRHPAQKQGCAHTSRLTLPRFPHGAAEETFCSCSALTRQGVAWGHPRFPESGSLSEDACCLFALQAGTAPAVLQHLLPCLLPSPQPVLEMGYGRVEAPARRPMSTGGNFIQWHCSHKWFMFYKVSYFQSHSVCNLDCQTHLSRNRIPSGNRSLWKYPHVYERHIISFLWKATFCR